MDINICIGIYKYIHVAYISICYMYKYIKYAYICIRLHYDLIVSVSY